MPGFWPIFWGPENLSKKSIFFFENFSGDPSDFGHYFGAIFGEKGFFSEKSDSATFYPLYTPNFMQNKLDKSMDPHNFLKKKIRKKMKKTKKLTD